MNNVIITIYNGWLWWDGYPEILASEYYIDDDGKMEKVQYKLPYSDIEYSGSTYG